MVTLRGIPFGSVFNAPGARGFYGGMEYWHQRLIQLAFGKIWEGTTLAVKTFTADKRAGNMPLRADGITPRELIPKAIRAYLIGGHLVNAVDLSNPGADWLLAQGRWQEWPKPFVLSWAAVGETAAEREGEIKALTNLFRRYRPRFRAPFAVQLNCGCPNVGRTDELTVEEVACWLEIASRLGVPLILNFSVAASVEKVLRMAALPGCDALWLANTVPWGDPRIDWKRLFGSDVSPLTRRGLPRPGGLSGPACLPLLLALVKGCREAGVILPIIGGNGIQSVADALRVLAAGADGIALGIVGLVRFWLLPGIVLAATKEVSN